VIALRRLDHVALRVADVAEASARWCAQFGLVERERDGARARLACDDESATSCAGITRSTTPAATSTPPTWRGRSVRTG
jgi:catechol 2,3-dioxygenase-like lactoylglutathione lyase family enzyme